MQESDSGIKVQLKAEINFGVLFISFLLARI